MLDARQQALLDEWLPGAAVVHDHSWGLVDTTVLELRHEGRRYIAKAGDKQLVREVRAHREWLRPWTSIGRAPRLVGGDADAKLVVTHYLPGELVQGSAHELSHDVFGQAGELLALLHAQFTVVDKDFEAKANAKALARLDTPHRIAPDLTARLRRLIGSWPTPPSTLVPTHGDWQPRNWLIHEGVVSVIDFGHADLRPALSDFSRIADRQFRADPTLDRTFVRAYGDDPRDPDAWWRHMVRGAIGIVTWAYQVGTESFEQEGHRMLADALSAR